MIPKYPNGICKISDDNTAVLFIDYGTLLFLTLQNDVDWECCKKPDVNIVRDHGKCMRCYNCREFWPIDDADTPEGVKAIVDFYREELKG